jgi:hypothetical protein
MNLTKKAVIGAEPQSAQLSPYCVSFFLSFFDDGYAGFMV